MHAFWAVLFLPIGVLAAWRFRGPLLGTMAWFATAATTIGLFVWMSVVAYQGSPLTETIADRATYAYETLVMAVSVPIVQLIAAFLLIAMACIPPRRSKAKATEEQKPSGTSQPEVVKQTV